MNVAVTTCRREKDYLWKCLNSLRKHGYHFPSVHYDVHKDGASENFIRALREKPRGHVLVIQDDFLVDAHYARVVSEVSTLPLISLYTHGYPETGFTITVDCSTHLLRARNCNGGCAFYLRSSTVKDLLDWSTPDNIHQPLPMMIGQFCHENGVPYLISGTNIGRHIGEVSAIKTRPEGFRYPLIDRSEI